MASQSLFRDSFLLFVLALPLQFCSKGGDKIQTTQFTEKQAPADALFTLKKPSECGISFSNDITETHENSIMTNSYLYNGGGVGVIDVNNDGLQDLYFVSTQGECKLYQNEGNLKFKDITAQAGVAAKNGDKTGVTVVDINADGWQDIYLCRTGMKSGDLRRNLLFINNKNGTFTESAQRVGLADASASNHANFFDMDNDGDLDCYVLNYPVEFETVNSMRLRELTPGGERVRVTDPSTNYDSDRLYKNDNGLFTDVSKQAGIWNRAYGLSVTTADLNGDGFQDIVVGNDYIDPDFVYINNPAQPGNFTDRYTSYFRHSSNHTMGVDIADINNDGLNDIIALDMLAESYSRQKELMTTMLTDRYTLLFNYGYGYQQMRNVLQINNGNGTFSDIGCLAGVFQTDWSWGPLLQDLDNDGWRDLFIANGYRRDVSNWDYLTYTADSVQRNGGFAKIPDINDYLNLIPATPLQNYCYRNRGDLSFEDVSTSWGFTQLAYSNGAITSDLDNDGDLDVVVNNIEGTAFVYQNRAREMGKGGNWLQVKCTGNGANPFAIGARARVQAGGQVQYADLTPNRGFLSSIENLLHFGLGAVTTIERLEVEFPGGKLIVMENIPANQRLNMDIKDAKPGQLTPPAKQTPLMQSASVPDFKHSEDEIQDFNNERLLPWRMSAPGPCMAVADVNGDGLDDCFIGNSVGSPGGLFVQSGSGFRASSSTTFQADKDYEDSGCVFFDADGDHDLDLFVVSGGNSFPAGSPNYPLRLYWNDGRGNFTKAQRGLPVLNQSLYAVSAHDYDGDGDQDLLLGGWCTPNAYPSAPNTYLLRNDRGVFSDVTAQVAAALSKIGLVRDFLWADLNGDKTAELVVTGEWMPVQVFRLNGGVFQNATADFGLDQTNGFWRSLAAADVDNDGDLDLVAGNLGLNSRYKASPEAPLRMFARDYDKNGSLDPIMTLHENGRDMPVATRDMMIKQLPMLKKKYVRYGAYSQAQIGDLFSENMLKGAIQLKCNLLASVVFINEKGRFKAQVLPNLAQVSPINAIEAVDVNQDGNTDLIVAGNDYGQQVETGRMDAGNGCVLLNDGKGNFTALPAQASGLWATREARDLKVLRGAGKKRIVLVANNNDRLQGFSF